MSSHHPAKHSIVVVGAGFGGVRAAKRLARYHGFDVTLISTSDSFSYFPQLYHAATGGSRSESAIPLTQILAHTRVRFIQDTIAGVDAAKRTVTGASGQTYHYDRLVLALGSITNFFGIKGLKEYSYDIKTITGAEQFKRHLHHELLTNHQTDLNYVVIGAGPTGVELSAALGDYLERITRLHGLARPKYHVRLIEAAPRVLPRSAEVVSAVVAKRLKGLRVDVMTGEAVKGETAERLKLGDESLTTNTVVWTAGVANNPLYASLPDTFKLDQRGHVIVDEHLEATTDIYVIGDNAAVKFAGLAQSALAHADYVARDIMRRTFRKPRRVFKPSEPISVIPVGKRWAVASWHGVNVYGILGAWLRRAADLVGYGDIESWPKAITVWLKEYRHENNCPVCDELQPAVE